MNLKPDNKPDNTFYLFWRALQKEMKRLWEWFLPKESDPGYMKITKLILKIPALLLIVILSPIVLVILVVTFVASL